MRVLEDVGKVLLVVAAIDLKVALAVHIYLTAGHDPIYVASFFGVPFLFAGATILIDWWRARVSLRLSKG